MLEKPWINVVGADPSTLHQLLKFIWEDHEIVIHGEGRDRNYPGFSVPIIEDSSQGTDFHIVEIMNASFEDTTPQIPVPSMYKMLASTILRSDFEPGGGQGKNLDDISKPLPIPLSDLALLIPQQRMNYSKETQGRSMVMIYKNLFHNCTSYLLLKL